ncbi:bifunctional hydroxymethylpyrimidine kinase/phosphomethylpyrimidine kinase [Thiomicrorhabdus hydrogeniphila]
MMQNPLPTVLTIAGSDSSAGAGIQADLKTIHAVGGYALTAITAITAQNSQGVQQVYPVTAKQLEAQLNALFVDYQINAIKIGMLANEALIKVVVEFIAKIRKQNPYISVILDPIILSSSGKPLLEEKAINFFRNKLLPLATLVTPNLPELNRLLNLPTHSEFIGTADEVPNILQQLTQNHWPNTLLKGGHSAENLAIDYLFSMPADSTTTETFAYPAQRINTQNTHGTGCTLSSAIATQLAFNRPLVEAVKLAKNYLQNALSTADYAQPHYQYNHSSHDANSFNNRHGGLNHFGQKAISILDEEE